MNDGFGFLQRCFGFPIFRNTIFGPLILSTLKNPLLCMSAPILAQQLFENGLGMPWVWAEHDKEWCGGTLVHMCVYIYRLYIYIHRLYILYIDYIYRLYIYIHIIYIYLYI